MNMQTIYSHLKIPFDTLEIYILSDGYFDIGSYQPIIATDAAPADLQNELNRLHLPADIYEAPINVMLIRKNEQLILVDTGEGFYDKKNAGKLLHSLKSAGFGASDISDVLITHAHRDHIGGILTENDNLVFPNARFYISRTELEFWFAQEPNFPNSRRPEFGHGSVSLVKKILGAITHRLEIFDAGDELLSCIKTQAAPGHTPGHIIFTVYSGKLSITHLVDLVHSPVLISNPVWGTQWDADFSLGINTRKNILEQCHKQKSVVCASHLPWPGIGFIDRSHDQWQWTPKPYISPLLLTF
ncbi:MBL fold metallo-hydrolase [Sphingobacterium athyrii]|uniref:MBL fold metallo-hydrolase n=1 Tax=Sphingobacterium athyrii TaxID=2152717 RepID=A0A363NUS5_9SPHI|nr:MBL fold metallo-hydrolase [Sphingobacterium athyrii]PUV24473.1 MBL fold metallo-hydrolase [Sphingobacterium athyrii]